MSLNRDSCLPETEEGCEADLLDSASVFWLKEMGQEKQKQPSNQLSPVATEGNPQPPEPLQFENGAF